jgi:hypothetical protein
MPCAVTGADVHEDDGSSDSGAVADAEELRNLNSANCRRQGKTSKEEIIALAAPIAFGRSTQVFDLPARKFPFGRARRASYRIPFFFVEGGVVKLYFLQPRKQHGSTFAQLGMVGTIHKRYLLDTEFFGQPTNVEYVSLAASGKDGLRVVRSYSLSDLEIWSDERLAKRLTVISEAIDKIEERGVLSKRRVVVRPTPAMPLFD